MLHKEKNQHEYIETLENVSNLLINIVIGVIYNLIDRNTSLKEISDITGIDINAIQVIKDKKCEAFASIMIEVANEMNIVPTQLH